MKTLSLLAVVTLSILAAPGAALAHGGPGDVPQVNRETPGDPGTPEERRSLRDEVTRWLRARQSVLLRCEVCSGSGTTFVTKSSPQGLQSVPRFHRACHGTGAVLFRRALADLYRPYLDDAEKLPCLGDKRLTAAEIQQMLENKDMPGDQKRTEMFPTLGYLQRSAQVRKMTFERPEPGLVVATVTTTDSPTILTWVLVAKRWRLVDPVDKDRALDLARQAFPPGQQG